MILLFDSWLCSHAIIYMVIIFSMTNVVYNCNEMTVKSIISSIVLGWGVYGWSSIGHDLLHSGYRKLACCLFDTWLISSETWIIMHHALHHQNPCTNKDTMWLRSNSIYSELYYLFIGPSIKNKKKNEPTSRSKQAPIWKMLLRIPFYTICIMFIKWQYLLITIISFRLCYGYLGFIGHCHAKTDYIQNEKWNIRQIQTSVDILPDSWFCSLITGGLNAHIVHHLNPITSRSMAGKESAQNKIYYGEKYRVIQTWVDLWIFWKTRYNDPKSLLLK